MPYAQNRTALPLAMAIMTAIGMLSHAVADEPATDEGVRYFETHIRPLLVDHCYECHGPETQESSLRLDTYAGLMTGGDSGAMIVAGKPQQSLLLGVVEYQNPDLQMPPDGKLSAQQIAVIKGWIEMGAPHPDAGSHPVPTAKRTGMNVEAGRGFWSFQAPQAAPLPRVGNNSWPNTAIDRFVLAKLEENGLQPATAADRRTLIRRTCGIVTGLPPSPEEVESFVGDDSPDALCRVIDRALASPHYGERWGRHWLDVARYADSNGLDENIHHGNAWRYRDYVVRALNEDKPFDEFVTEQIAGDLLPKSEDTQQRYDRLIATGFLSIGPKVLAEVDETKMEMDIIDEQLDTLGRSMMGLTLGCARCHDHKFDPISAKDYYALAGIFKSTRVMEHYTKIARWHEHSIPTPAELELLATYDAKVANAKSQVDLLVATANQALLDSKASGATLPDNAEDQYPDDTKAELKKLRDALTALEKEKPAVSTAMGTEDRDIVDLPVHIRGSHLTLGETVPRRFPIVMAGEEQPDFGNGSSGRLRLAEWLTSSDHPLTSRVIVNRIWHWHFGQGLVGTPDNFGILGEKPVNQPLLDWLAVRLQRDGWSMKKLHREILMSATWQMGSQQNPQAEAVDPENRLQWRANLRRLEAEAIRDSILLVSGQLDRSMGGTLCTIENRSFFFDHTSKDETDYSATRRSIYLPVVRNHLYEVFSLFDYSDAGSVVGSRTTSTIAPQALFMMNSEFMQQASRELAARIAAASGEDEDRVRRLYRIVLSREPGADELQRAVDLVQRLYADEETNDDAWALLAQVLLSSNEFIYLE